MATQRPSVDVITGTIKANFPTRISFQVTSKIDSRTILGEQGAEQLLGQGDMLYMAGGGRIQRVHGPFVTDDEVEEVVAHLKAQGAPEYLDAITDDEDEIDGANYDEMASAATCENPSDLYDQAVADRAPRPQGLDQLHPAPPLDRLQSAPPRSSSGWRRKASSAPPIMPASARFSLEKMMKMVSAKSRNGLAWAARRELAILDRDIARGSISESPRRIGLIGGIGASIAWRGWLRCCMDRARRGSSRGRASPYRPAPRRSRTFRCGARGLSSSTDAHRIDTVAEVTAKPRHRWPRRRLRQRPSLRTIRRRLRLPTGQTRQAAKPPFKASANSPPRPSSRQPSPRSATISTAFARWRGSSSSSGRTASSRRASSYLQARQDPLPLQAAGQARRDRRRQDVSVRNNRTMTQDFYPLSKTPLRYLLAEHVDLALGQVVSDVREEPDLIAIVIVEKSASSTAS